MADDRGTQTSQGDATKCRCGRTEFFPKDCPCQKLPPRDGRSGTSLREGDHLEYLGPQECAVTLSHAEADALLSMLEQAHNAGFAPGVGLRIEDVRLAGFKIVSERFRDQDPYSRGRRLVGTVSRAGKDAPRG